MKALVTGATGFLGSHVARRLHQLGWDVLATGRNLQEGRRLEELGIPFTKANLHDRTISALCEGKDVVFHCGAHCAPWGPFEDFYSANVRGTQTIIEGCQKYGVPRLIHVSTPSIYFDGRDRFKISEQDPLPVKKANHYATTKWMAEQEVDKAFANGLPAITIRPRALFGPGDRTILPRLLQANKKGALPLIDHGKAQIDITYVENVVDALLLCVDSPESTLGKKYNITNGQPIYLSEFLHQLLDRLGEPKHFKPISYRFATLLATVLEGVAYFQRKEPLLTRYTVGLLGKNQTLDIRAAQEELGYIPRVSISEGIERYATWRESESCTQ